MFKSFHVFILSLICIMAQCMKNTNRVTCVWYKTLKVKSKHLKPLSGNSGKFLFLLQPIIWQNNATKSSNGKSNSNSLVPNRPLRFGCDITCQACRENSRSVPSLPYTFEQRKLTWGRGCSSKRCFIYLYQSLRLSRQIDPSERL